MNKRFHISEITIGDTRFVPSPDGKMIHAYIPCPNHNGTHEKLYASYHVNDDNPVFLLFQGVLGQAQISLAQNQPQPGPIIHEWCHTLGLRHQGCLMGAIRGCDGIPKEDPSKWLVRFYRACVLRAHCVDPRKAASFMEWTDSVDEFKTKAKLFLSDFDRYPMHYVFHLLHGSGVIGYNYPEDKPQREMWHWFYMTMCRKLHLNPETKEQMDTRLNKKEPEFGKDQKL